MFFVVLTFTVFWGYREVSANYEYSNTIGSYWELSDKSSTLIQKSTYLDKYVTSLETAKLAVNNAIIFPTPNNNVEQNMIALKSLQGRMHQIHNMDEQSFAYQTAIQQITAQEQGEGHKLIDTFKGAWFLANYPSLWGWIDGVIWLCIVVSIIISLTILLADM